MKRHIYVIIFLILVLGGCNSFNNSFNNYPSVPPFKIEKVEESEKEILPKDFDKDDEVVPSQSPTLPKSSQKVPENEAITCSVSPYPSPGMPPELPVKELQAAAGDVYAIERIERKHINELRAYITERRRLLRAARKTFNEQCWTIPKH